MLKPDINKYVMIRGAFITITALTKRLINMYTYRSTNFLGRPLFNSDFSRDSWPN